MADRDLLAETLENIALLLELKGENPFKTRAYRTGAETVRSHSGDIVQLAKDEDLKGIKGIGDALASKLHELASTGKLEFYEKLRAEFPETIFELFEIQGLGAKKVKALHEELKIASVEDLKKACEEGAVAALSGFGKKTEEKILAAIEYRETHASLFRMEQVSAAAERTLEVLRNHPAVSRVDVAGSYRRGKEVVHDLDFLVATKKPGDVMQAFVGQEEVEEILVNGETKSSVRMENGLQCDLRAVKNEEYPFALAYFTGSKEHNVEIRGRCLKKGFTLNEYRLEAVSEEAGDLPEIHSEEDLYELLGLDYVEPALRENNGEVEAAEDGNLPKLIELENLRGTFHNHTTESDGKNTLREMAEGARELGLQYLGISDHSKSSFQANGLDERRLKKQKEDIAELNEEFGEDFRLFSGTECDILKDGSLDFDDDVLSSLDYVVASVHNAFSLAEAEMTKRIISAIENPNVTMLGHLTGRLLLKREPYAVNVPAIIDAAADTGTIIEINANPWRLDMDWRWWKLAKEKGVKCAINPDAHSVDGFQFLAFGVKVARKGWLTREDVVNCLPLGEIESVLAAKRK
ncbi:MAG: DNA polymerase/3'-5' exonuclease PolX [Verrucomicrobiota bacterium]